MFKKAERKKCKLKLAITGPSGSGKTMGALNLAKGLGGRIAVIDTENDSASLFTHIVDFDVMGLAPPYTPDKYVDAINLAKKYDILIIDSITPEWAGEGGILDIKTGLDSTAKNSYAAWGIVTPMHNKFLNAIIHASNHVIVTIRSKTAHEMVRDDDSGKVQIKKMGLAPIQRDGIDYEFSVVFDLSENHLASCSKDRTGMFDGKTTDLQPSIGEQLIEWCDTGIDFEAESFKQMNNLVDKASGCATLDGLRNWYLENKAAISQLAATHEKELLEAINTLKSKLMEAKVA